MITTITLNTAVDKLYLVEEVELGAVMRVKEVCNTAGGKGLNVSKVAALAGESVRAMGFLGGFNGQYVRSLLERDGICTDFVEIEGETRFCINIRNLSTGQHTEFLEPGCSVPPADLEAFLQRYDKALADTDVVTISGSVPLGVPADFYGQLVARGRAGGKPVLLDTSGQLLIHGAAAKPTLIKPNTDEIAQLLGTGIHSRQQLMDAALELHRGGIPYVVVSLGKEGALIACQEGIFQGVTPDIPVVNTVGCGDSMVAGFAVGISRGYTVEEIIRFATAISTANALTTQTGSFRQEDFARLLTQVEARRL